MQKSRECANLKVIFDTRSYVAAVISEKGVSAKALWLAHQGTIVNFYSEEIISELQRTLKREKFSLEKEQQEYFINFVMDSSFLIEQDEDHKVKLCRDNSDDKFLSLAKQIEADFIITRDEDLLILKNIGKTKITTPSEFIKHFM